MQDQHWGGGGEASGGLNTLPKGSLAQLPDKDSPLTTSPSPPMERPLWPRKSPAGSLFSVIKTWDMLHSLLLCAGLPPTLKEPGVGVLVAQACPAFLDDLGNSVWFPTTHLQKCISWFVSSSAQRRGAERGAYWGNAIKSISFHTVFGGRNTFWNGQICSPRASPRLWTFKLKTEFSPYHHNHQIPHFQWPAMCDAFSKLRILSDVLHKLSQFPLQQP